MLTEINMMANGRETNVQEKVTLFANLGSCRYATGDNYNGMWDNDMKNGQGTFSV